MKYIDAELLRKEIEKHNKEIKDAAERFTPNLGFFDAKLSGIYDVMAIIDSHQQEQPDTDGLYLELADFLTKNDVPEEKAKFLANRILDLYGSKKYLEGLCDGIKQEQPEADFKIEERKWIHDAVDNVFPEDGDFMSEVDFRKILKDTARHFYELGKNSK